MFVNNVLKRNISVAFNDEDLMEFLRFKGVEVREGANLNVITEGIEDFFFRGNKVAKAHKLIITFVEFKHIEETEL